jgi:putative transposase
MPVRGIKDGHMVLSPLGRIAEEQWLWLPVRFPNWATDAFQVMPNHMHGVLKKGSAVVRTDKSAVTFRFQQTLASKGQSLWQRNYSEHIVRDEDDLDRIRLYIQENPSRWSEDENYILHASHELGRNDPSIMHGLSRRRCARLQSINNPRSGSGMLRPCTKCKRTTAGNRSAAPEAGFSGRMYYLNQSSLKPHNHRREPCHHKRS